MNQENEIIYPYNTHEKDAFGDDIWVFAPEPKDDFSTIETLDKMDYKDFYKSYQSYLTAFEKYASENNGLTESYHVAKNFLTDMAQKAYTNLEFRSEFKDWLDNGGTLKLKELLSKVNYDDTNLTQFNAFSLMDTVTTKIEPKSKYVSNYEGNKLNMAKREAFLNTRISVNGNIVTNKENIENKINDGWVIDKKEVINESASKKINEELKYLRKTAPWGNENHPDTKRLIELTSLEKSPYDDTERVVRKTVVRLLNPNNNRIVDLTSYGEDYAKEYIHNKELTEGIQHEQEHKETLEKVATGEITVDEAVEEISETHLENNSKYYTNLENMENKTFEKDDRFLDTKKNKEGVVTRKFKPSKGSTLENEPYLIDIKYDDGNKAINMPVGDRFVFIDAIENKPTEVELSLEYNNLVQEINKYIKQDNPSTGKSMVGILDNFVNDNPEFFVEYVKFVYSIPTKYRVRVNPYDRDFGVNKDNVANYLEEKGINLLELMPVKNYVLPKYKPFETTISDNTFMSIHDSFVGLDSLRPKLMGTNFDDLGVASTNAHTMLFTPYRGEAQSDRGLYCHTSKCFKANNGEDQIKESFPQYRQVVPKENPLKVSVNEGALYNFLRNSIELKIVNSTTKSVILSTEDSNSTDNKYLIGFNGELIESALEAMVKLGHKEVEFAFSTPNRAALIYPKGKYSEINRFSTDFVLVMPIMLDGSGPNVIITDIFDLDSNCMNFIRNDYKYCFDIDAVERKNIEKKVKDTESELEVSKARIKSMEDVEANRQAEKKAKADRKAALLAENEKIAKEEADRKAAELQAIEDSRIEAERLSAIELENNSYENLSASLDAARSTVDFLEGQEQQDMQDYIDGLEIVVEDMAPIVENTKETIWKNWTKDERLEFLKKNKTEINKRWKKEGNKNSTLKLDAWYTHLFNELPDAIKESIPDKYELGGSITTNETYESDLREYNKVGAMLEDAIEEKNESEVAILKQRLSDIESKIHKHERSNSGGKFNPSSLIGMRIWNQESLRPSSKIIGVTIVSKDNIKLEIQSIGLNSSSEESFTLKELLELNDGKKIRNNTMWIIDKPVTMGKGGPIPAGFGHGYKGKKGEKFVIQEHGIKTGDVETWFLFNANTVEMLDAYFDKKEDAEGYAKHNGFIVVDKFDVDKYRKGGPIRPAYSPSKYLTESEYNKWMDYVETGKIDGKKENNMFTVGRHIGTSVSKFNAYNIEQNRKKLPLADQYGLGGLLVGAALGVAGTLGVQQLGKNKPEQVVTIKKNDVDETWREYVIMSIDKEGFDNAFIEHGDYTNKTKDKKFHSLRKAYINSMNKLKSSIDKLSPKQKETIEFSIDKEGFDYALTGYNDWKKEIRNAAFHKSRTDYIAKQKALADYIGYQNT